MILYKEASKTPKANCLFMPGIPGRIKDFAIFDDLVKENINVYFHQYPGTHGNEGEFTIETATQSLHDSISELNDKGLPLLLIAYSFSTLPMFTFDFTQYKNIISLSFFSPIRGLDKNSIGEDFIASLKELVQSDEYHIDEQKWITYLPNSKVKDIQETLRKLTELEFPITFAYSLNDNVIKAKTLDTELEKFRKKYGYGTFLVFSSTEGFHKLDSYYTVIIGHYIKALMIKEDLLKLLGGDTAVYYWGSSQIYDLFRNDSDIDLLAFKDGYLDRYKDLNEYVQEYGKSHDIKFDLSINNKYDLLSNKIFRFNRGPVIIHGVQTAYFPLKKVEKTMKPKWKDVVRDGYRVNLINLLEAQKIICKSDIKSDRVKKMVKFYVMSILYLLYARGIKNVDMNKLPSYLKEDDLLLPTLQKSITLFKSHFEGLSIEFLYECTMALEKVVKEQEKLLHIKAKDYAHNI